MKRQRLTNYQILLGAIIFLVLMGLVGGMDRRSQMVSAPTVAEKQAVQDQDRDERAALYLVGKGGR